MTPSALPPSRAAAKAAGVSRYFNGRPCPRGHQSPRYTVNHECVACAVARSRAERIACAADPIQRALQAVKDRSRLRVWRAKQRTGQANSEMG